jgi:xanthine dehydrogenase YagR molybdenum-binding subunit
MSAPSKAVRIGDAVNRVDGIAKVTGKARYAAEHPVAGLLYGWIVSSSIARGRITQLRDAAAHAVPGVVEIITHHNHPALARSNKKYQDQVAPPGTPFRALADDKIAFSGQPVALVVAETLEVARYAASLVEAEYEQARHNTSLEVAMPERFVPKKLRDAYKPPKSRGDASAAFEAAPIKISEDYYLPTNFHNPMEPHAAIAIWEDEERITVYDKTQGSQNVQAYLAGVFGLKEEHVRVCNPYVGGAFGSALRPQYHVYLAVMAARMLKRPVKVCMTRQQMFTHVHRPQAMQSVALATDAEGRLQAIINDATTVTSRFEDYMEILCNWGLMNYACANASAESTITKVDTYTPGDMRAPGAATGMTLFEMAVDEMAHAAGVDPLQFRLLNYSEKDAMDDKEYTSKALREAYAQGAARFGWQARSAAPGSMRDGKELIGYGMATGMWDALFMPTTVRAVLKPDGKLEVSSAASDIGPGTYTLMAQVASDTLGIPLSDITPTLGDSSLPKSPLEGGSWTAASTGAAVQLACKDIGEKLLKAAGKMKASPLASAKWDEVSFEDGWIRLKSDATRQVTIREVIAAVGGETIEVERTAKPGPKDLISLMRKTRSTHSAIFAEVRVDEQLGVIRVTRVVVAVAAGRIVNPKTARSQILGGVVMGIGMALHEEGQLDHRFGRYMNHSFSEYHIPTNADIDDIEVIFVDELDSEVTPLGVKGLGEIGIVGTAAAVANAIFHATGKRVRRLPITMDKLPDA